MTELVDDYNMALTKISAILPVRRSSDNTFIQNWGQLTQVLLDVSPGSSMMFTPVVIEKRSGRIVIRMDSETINYSPKG